MGNFKLVLEMVGGHGCCRDQKDGEQVFGCGQAGCPDCRIQEFVNDCAARYSIISAQLIHWPGTPTVVVDEIVPPARSIKTYSGPSIDGADGKDVPFISFTPGHRVRRGNF